MDILLASFGPAFIAALGGFPVLLALGLLVCLGALLRCSRHRQRRLRALSDSRARSPSPGSGNDGHPRESLWDPAVQLRAIEKVGFEPKQLLNDGEYHVLTILERCVQQHGQGHRVMGQAALGEYLGTVRGNATRREEKDAHSSINSKRADLLVIDRARLPVLVVEMQGAGHYQGDAYMRDAVKREALRRAGIDLLEVDKNWTDDEIERRVLRLIGGGQRQPGTRGATAPGARGQEPGLGAVPL